MNLDPTRDEMLAVLKRDCAYADQFDREAAIYWFASDWHGGQSSNLYAALSTSEYTPGAIENECPEDAGSDCYEALAEAFGRHAGCDL